jgi:hypothetical protein
MLLVWRVTLHLPHEFDMEAIFQNLQYLKSSPSKGLMFSQYDHWKIEAYTDGHWAGSIMD